MIDIDLLHKNIGNTSKRCGKTTLRLVNLICTSLLDANKNIKLVYFCEFYRIVETHVIPRLYELCEYYNVSFTKKYSTCNYYINGKLLIFTKYETCGLDNYYIV